MRFVCSCVGCVYQWFLCFAFVYASSGMSIPENLFSMEHLHSWDMSTWGSRKLEDDKKTVLSVIDKYDCSFLRETNEQLIFFRFSRRFPQERICERTGEEFDDCSQERSRERTGRLMCLLHTLWKTQEEVSVRIVEQTTYVPVPQIMKEIVTVTSLILQKRCLIQQIQEQSCEVTRRFRRTECQYESRSRLRMYQFHRPWKRSLKLRIWSFRTESDTADPEAELWIDQGDSAERCQYESRGGLCYGQFRRSWRDHWSCRRGSDIVKFRSRLLMCSQRFRRCGCQNASWSRSSMSLFRRSGTRKLKKRDCSFRSALNDAYPEAVCWRVQDDSARTDEGVDLTSTTESGTRGWSFSRWHAWIKRSWRWAHHSSRAVTLWKRSRGLIVKRWTGASLRVSCFQ